MRDTNAGSFATSLCSADAVLLGSSTAVQNFGGDLGQRGDGGDLLDRLLNQNLWIDCCSRWHAFLPAAVRPKYYRICGSPT